jgi:hypothetical protein
MDKPGIGRVFLLSSRLYRMFMNGVVADQLNSKCRWDLLFSWAKMASGLTEIPFAVILRRGHVYRNPNADH